MNAESSSLIPVGEGVRVLSKLVGYNGNEIAPCASYTKDCFRMVHRAHQGEGRFCITLMNPTNQPLEDVKIAALTQKEEVTVYTQYQPEAPYKTAAVQDGAYREITVKKLPPFEMVLIEL